MVGRLLKQTCATQQECPCPWRSLEGCTCTRQNRYNTCITVSTYSKPRTACTYVLYAYSTNTYYVTGRAVSALDSTVSMYNTVSTYSTYSMYGTVTSYTTAYSTVSMHSTVSTGARNICCCKYGCKAASHRRPIPIRAGTSSAPELSSRGLFQWLEQTSKFQPLKHTFRVILGAPRRGPAHHGIRL